MPPPPAVDPDPSAPARGAGFPRLVFFLLAALVLGGPVESLRAQENLCPNTSQPGQRISISCAETADIDIDLQNPSLVTTDSGSSGIDISHGGTGNINIRVTGGTVETQGANSHPIFVQQTNSGNVDIQLKDVAVVSRYGTGIDAAILSDGSNNGGDIRVLVESGSVTTQGDSFPAINLSNNRPGDVEAEIRNAAIETSGNKSPGLLVHRYSIGGFRIRVEGGSVTTTGGRLSHGIHAWGQRTLDEGEGLVPTSGDLSLSLKDARVATESTSTVGTDLTWAHAIYAQLGTMEMSDMNVDVTGGSVSTKGPGSRGIQAWHQGTGDIKVDLTDVRITTEGDTAYGAFPTHSGDGNIDFTMNGGSILTQSDSAHGIDARQQRGTDSGDIRVVVDGGSIEAAGAGASAIRAGGFDTDGAVARAAGFGEDGYRRQTVVVNGQAQGGSGDEAAGVYLSGGGTVEVGPQGHLGAKSGMAILATNNTTDNQSPKLRVRMMLDGRRVADFIGDDWIMNDGGETEIIADGVKLYDGETGATGLSAAYAARDLTLRADGVRVTDRSDPENFILSERSGEIIADRDFSAADFIYAYAPRAAVYEALPGFLLRLESTGPRDVLTTSSDTPFWMRLEGGWGDYESKSASVGASYDSRRATAEAGMNFSVGDGLTAAASLHYAYGEADVTAPTGGGEIEAKGVGLGLRAIWEGAAGWYAGGRFSLTRYDTDFSSATRGALAKDVRAHVHSTALEAGRRFARNDGTTLTPRIWATHSGASMDGFTDTVDAQISLDRAWWWLGGVGVVGERKNEVEGGEFLLRGSADLGRILSGEETRTLVSGEKLRSKTAKTRLLLGFSGTYRRDDFSLSGKVTADRPGSDDEIYDVSVELGTQF